MATQQRNQDLPPMYASARPLVNIQAPGKRDFKASVKLPTVFLTPIRLDVVRFVHTNMRKNSRQPYAVSLLSGHQTSAESWGTGRAVSRIPRVSGSGTHRAGQGAFGNMCRGGRMFAPTKIWRRWHRKINLNERRFAVASALAATALPALVMARGHRVERVPEIPLVLDNKAVDSLEKTKKAIAVLKALNAFDDIERVKETHKVRPGKGKYRNRRYVQKRGPLVVYNERGPLVKALRNLPGVQTTSVHSLNLLQLAPGGHLGRFVIWTKDAFQALDSVFGSYKKGSSEKSGYLLPKTSVTNPDIHRVLNSDEIQTAVRDTKGAPRNFHRKRNPLKNFALLNKLNPYASVLRRREIVNSQKDKKAAVVDAKRKGTEKKATDKKPFVNKNAKKFNKLLLS